MLPRNPNAFANSPLDRAAHRRRDAAWLAEARAAELSRLIPFHQNKPFIIERDGAVEAGWLAAFMAASMSSEEPALLFLGNDAKGVAHFAIDLADPTPIEGLGRFEDLRPIGPRLAAEDVAMLGCAKAIFEWHARNGFCAKCGARTAIVEAGWKRECAACGSEHFPRVDPVVIMAPVFGERVLLGRQKAWPKGMHSALAGFVEPGETVEEAIARETLEEAGLVVSSVRLHSTQPWPFPSSLMIGALCEVTHNNAQVDAHELESARWFTREEARALIAGTHGECFAPPPFAIAHHLLKAFAEE